jgi:hypothetical protein
MPPRYVTLPSTVAGRPRSISEGTDLGNHNAPDTPRPAVAVILRRHSGSTFAASS